MKLFFKILGRAKVYRNNYSVHRFS